jgi:hypothetical protein
MRENLKLMKSVATPKHEVSKRVIDMASEVE